MRIASDVQLWPYAVYEEQEELPSIFVLMGNFHSFPCTTATTNYAALRDDFSALGTVLSKHTRIMVRVLSVSVTPYRAACVREARFSMLKTKPQQRFPRASKGKVSVAAMRPPAINILSQI